MKCRMCDKELYAKNRVGLCRQCHSRVSINKLFGRDPFTPRQVCPLTPVKKSLPDLPMEERRYLKIPDDVLY